MTATAEPAARDLLALSFHEAGHAVAAEIVGAGWSSATIAADSPEYDGVVRFPTIADPIANAFVFWAGVCAEARHRGVSARDLADAGHADHDRQHFEPITTADPGIAKDWRALLVENWDRIERVATTLHVHQTITPDDLVPTSLAARYLYGDRRPSVAVVVDLPGGADSGDSRRQDGRGREGGATDASRDRVGTGLPTRSPLAGALA